MLDLANHVRKVWQTSKICQRIW